MAGDREGGPAGRGEGGAAHSPCTASEALRDSVAVSAGATMLVWGWGSGSGWSRRGGLQGAAGMGLRLGPSQGSAASEMLLCCFGRKEESVWTCTAGVTVWQVSSPGEGGDGEQHPPAF